MKLIINSIHLRQPMLAYFRQGVSKGISKAHSRANVTFPSVGDDHSKDNEGDKRDKESSRCLPSVHHFIVSKDLTHSDSHLSPLATL